MGARARCGVLALLVVLCAAKATAYATLSKAYFVGSERSLLSEWDSPEQYSTRTEAELASQVFSAVDAAAGAGPAVLLALISQSPPEATPVPVEDEATVITQEAAPASDSADLISDLFGSTPGAVFTSVKQSCMGTSFKEHLLVAAKARPASVAGVQLGGACSDDTVQSHSVQSFVRSWAKGAPQEVKGVTLLVYCLTPADNPGLELTTAYKALGNVTVNFGAVLVQQAPPTDSAECRRSLILATKPPSANSTCDATCRVKASLLEAAFVAIVLLIALVSGLCCLVDLDTPTKFEVPAES